MKYYTVVAILLILFTSSCSFYGPPVAEQVNETVSDTLYVYGWKDYFGNVSSFEEKYNISVVVFEFKDENEMVSQVQSATYKYDVFIASDVIVAEMNRMRLLSNIRTDNIPNLKYVDLKFLNNSYDPDQRFSIPYLWGTTGIVANSKYVNNVESWGVLWNPEYSKKISILSDPDEVMASALKYSGFSLTSTIPSERSHARDKLVKQKELVTNFKSNNELYNAIVSEKIWVSQLYSRDFARLRNSNPSLKYYVPKEGAALWVDNFVISRDSNNKYAAELFIDHYLDPKINAKVANNLWMATTNLGAKAYMNQEIINDKAIYLPDSIYAKCEPFLQKPYTTRFG